MSSSMSGRVARLWRYPVKSMGGQRVDGLTIDERGVVGDRCFAVCTESGKVASGKSTRRFERVDGLLTLSATTNDDGVPSICSPEGRTLRGDDPGVHAFLSETLARPLTLVAEDQVSHFDAAPIHIITEASVEWLRQRTPGVATDERRLRPNIVIAIDDPALSEDAWVGRELSIGAVRLLVRERTERCVMVGYAQGDLPLAPSALRSIAEDNEACLGVYAEVIEPGKVSAGDVVTIAPA